MNSKLLKEFQKVINYQFNQSQLLVQALTHSSYANERNINKLLNNERLEFLGDAVLELISSDFLFKTYPDLPEGILTKKRASYVCEPTLALCARELDLGQYLFLGKGENNTGGRERASLLSDALEAVIGAIYLDGGIENAATFINSFILNNIENRIMFNDCKTLLQEIVQSRSKEPISYELIDATGPEHDRQFVIQVILGEKPLGIGRGRTKQAAGQEAAYQSILQLKNIYDDIDENMTGLV